jgi:energy-coupling factor transporter ATP-binding protein EcfA2
MNRVLGSFIFFILFLVCGNGFSQELCIPSEVDRNYIKVLEIIDRQSLEISQILKGKLESSYSTSSLFGPDFKLEKTKDVIEDLKNQVEHLNGLSPEHRSLYRCLDRGALVVKKDILVEKSKRLIGLRIELLKRNLELKNAIVEGLKSRNDLPEIKGEIQKETKDTELIKKGLEIDLLRDERLIYSSVEASGKEFANYKNTLTKLKIEFLEKKIEYNKNLEQKFKYFEEVSNKLSQVSSELDPQKPEKNEKNFEKLESIWLDVTKENFFHLFNNKEGFRLPLIPNEFSVIDYSASKSREALGQQYRDLQEFKLKTLKELTLKKEQELKLLNDLIVQVNGLRSAYYSILDTNYAAKRFFSEIGFKLLINEIKASPYRALSYFYTKYLYLSEKIARGRDGLKDIALDIFKLLILIFGFFLVKILLKRVYLYIDSKQAIWMSRYNRSFIVQSFSSFWNKFKDNAILLCWLLVMVVLEEQKIADGYEIFFDVCEVVIFSKILKSLVVLFLGSISKIDFKSFLSFKKKANETSEKFSNIFLYYFLTMIFIRLTIGQVYVYSLVNVIALIYSCYYLVRTSAAWEDEFNLYLERKFSGIIIEKLEVFFNLFPKLIKATLIFFAIIILSFFDLIIRLTENLEISKKISANLFKKQIEKAGTEEQGENDIPESYKEKFSFSSLEDDQEFVEPDEHIDQNLRVEVEEWVDGVSEEHILVVYGDKGIGKTTLLKHCKTEIEKTHGEDLNVIYKKMPAKITDNSKLQNYIMEIFEFSNNEGSFDIFQIDRSLKKKTIVIIDEAQNIFLSHTGGFEAYYAFINTINLSTENIFWIMSFNKYSWLYLDRAFGRTQFFRNVFEIKGWSDIKIKELIMKRHYKSEMKLSYDLLINATRSQDEIDKYSSIESKFFKLLWELSRGNPRAALYMWLTALSRRNRTTFNVNIPKEVEFEGLEKLPDDLMFVIAHLIKHENLSSSELEQTTSLPKGLVRNAIKVGQEKKFIYKDPRGRYMVELAAQYGLIKYLRLKNFIYGS